ncbi:glycoside hydrolase family 6 protein [Streptomyces sp. NPDC002054]|uniref:glycoside hydrolase family 6 protein n=1 Tax=Streptomyces sp. NPDC002054 TaxID=3154663 RepID=UPI00331A81CE
MPGPRRRHLAPLVVMLALALTAGCTADRPAPATPAAGAAADPTEEEESPFWVDPQSEAARQVEAWEAHGRTADAQVLRRIADRPMALWGPAGDPGPELRRAARSAKAAKRTLVLTAYHLPHRRDCGRPSADGASAGGASARGAKDGPAYRRWIGAFAEAVGDARALVVLEPGAVAQLLDGCTPAARHDERLQLLAEAVDRLKRNRNTKVYLDAGSPAWVRDPGRLVEPLRAAGLERADGFAVNVSDFQTDADGRAYGAELSERTGGRHFVLDTGRNGDGPLPGDPAQARCNPPGRSLGTPPTDRTGDPLVDAYLWIKRPGASDGTCRGGPTAGTWWPDYALGLARRARQ